MRLIKLEEVKRNTGLGKTSIYELMKTGDFPASVKLIGNCVGWVETEVEQWILDRIAQRDQK